MADKERPSDHGRGLVDTGRRAALRRLGVAATVAYAAPAVLRLRRGQAQTLAVTPPPPPPSPGALGLDPLDAPDPFDAPTTD